MNRHYRTADEVKAEFGAKPRRALVITTVKHESRAVRSHLVDIETITGSNSALYDLGRFSEPAGDWAVVQAFCQAGNNDATAVAMKAIAEFGGFDVAMFVGVAGSLKEDVPIGSVVVGNFVYNSHSGKEEDAGFQSRPHGYPAANELIHAANALILDDSWIDFIKAPQRTQLPPVGEYPCPYPPEAVIKPIASGEQVVAGGKGPHYAMIRQRLNDAAAVEMEGYGTMTAAHQENTSAIIVRGISDMCAGKDHTKDKLDQPIAAAHAAAFAFGILSIRSRASPLSPEGTGLPTQAPEHDKPESSSDRRIDYVVNFKGSRSDWSEAEIERVLEGLRQTTGDPDLTLVRVDEGSVRLVVSVREKDIPTLTLDTVRTAAGDAGGELLGAVTAQELTEAEKAKAALKKASADLLSWEKTLPGGAWLERPEQGTIENRFRSDCSSTVVLGEPGSGKSALLAAIATKLVESDASVLAIKADFVSSEVHSESDLQEDLGLPALPGNLIERLAQLQPVFLFVDQLDALAAQLDLKSDRLNVLLNLIRRVGGLPNVHIVLSARTFEFNHDVRLRAIEAEAVPLALPAWHEVKEKLSSAGIDASKWPENAREVIRNPQALKTYLSLSKADDDEPFSKYQAMLEQLWRQKIGTAPDSEAMASLASDLAGTMAEEETLWLAGSRFDTRISALQRLESVGLVVRSDNGQSIAFSHQTVFEYVLARSFVRTAGRLSAYILERQNSLFVRAKLWSALRYLRDAEVTSYAREFSEIWKCKDLRRHLRLLLIEFLGEQHIPVEFEKVYLEEAMQAADLRLAALKAIVGSPGWFANFSRSAIPSAMSANEVESLQALRILQKAWSFSMEEVIRLLREQWLPLPEKDGLVWMTLDACPTWPEVIEYIASTILSRTDIGAWQVDNTASALIVHQPEVAFRLVRTKLDYYLDRARTVLSGKPFPTNGTLQEQIAWQAHDNPTKPFTTILEGVEWNSLPAMAEAKPKEFLEVVWPWFRSIFAELKDRDRQEASDYLFAGLYSVDIHLGDEKPGRSGREYPILSSLCLAISGVASDDDAYFSRWAENNSDMEFAAPQRLIAYGFGRAPRKYAHQAFNWLLSDQRRLQLGDIRGLRTTTANLIKAVAPYWSDEEVRKFEVRIQEYRPNIPAHLTEAEQRRSFSNFIRMTKAHLMAAIPVDRLSEKSRELIAIEKRALGENLNREVVHSEARFIGSPMEAQAMAKAKDRDILKAFEEVPDNTNWHHPNGWMRGGNIQLSRAFAGFAKAEPMRALRIMEQFNPRAQERAAGYALDSIAEGPGHDRELQDALLDLHERGFGTEEFRNSASHALEKVANRPSAIEEAVIAVLIGWLTQPTEQPESIDKDEAPTGPGGETERTNDDRHESILWGHGGFSVLPGGNFPTLSALSSILLKGEDARRDRLFAILSDHLEREQDPKVWQALLIQLGYAGGSTPEVVSKFLRALFNHFPTLLETREAVYFLAYAQRWDDVLVHDLIATWDNAENAMLRQAQGELVGLISTVRGSGRWTTMREQLLERGSSEAKVGLAYAGANLWNETKFHGAAGRLLERLVVDADRERMSAILDVFRLCNELTPSPTTVAFLRTLARPDVSLAGAPSNFIVERLQSLLPHAADIVGEIALKLVRAWQSDLNDVRTAAVTATPQLTDLAITLHRLGGTSRQTGVTIFETLLDLDAYGTRDTLAEIDGRFGVRQTGARPRIRRRTAKRRAA